MINANANVGLMTYGNTLALLHMDGSDGGTTFTDSTGYQTWSPTSATTATAQKKFGTASFSLETVAPIPKITSSVAIPLLGSFTIEFWFYFVAAPATSAYFVSTGTNPLDLGIIWNQAAGRFEMYSNNGNSYNHISHAQPTTGSWHHFAWSYDRTTHRIFYDGTLLTNSLTGSFVAPNRTFILGSNNGTDETEGYMDEFRISRIPRYTEAFTPSASAFTLD